MESQLLSKAKSLKNNGDFANVKMLLNGEFVDSKSDHFEQIRNPATGQSIGKVPFCTL